MSGKFALIIGNTEYTDPGLSQLTAPGKDAEDFARVLKDANICAFYDVKVLLNQISSSVIEAVDEFFDQKKPDDLLVLYFSGHGVRDELGALYLAVRNTIRSRLRSTAIKSDYIREAMDQSRSRRQVLILDCCNSGAFTQGTKAEVGGTMGMVSAFQGYGRYVLTASDATQFAWEGNQVIGETDNSLFTHFLVKGLEGEADGDGDGKITVDELYDYAFEQIVSVTPKQKPNKSATKQEGEIVLRQITRIEDIKPVSLPDELMEATEDPRTFVREGVVHQLEKLLKGKNLGLARSARTALERMEREDDSRRVSQAATQALETARQAEQKAEEENKAKEETERLAILKAEEERRALERAEEEAQRLRRAQAEREFMEEEAARLKAEHESAELAAPEVAESTVEEKVENQVTEIEAPPVSNKFGQLFTHTQVGWETVLNYLKSSPKSRFQVYMPVVLVVLLIMAIASSFYPQFNSTLYFSSTKAGGTNIFSYRKNSATTITRSAGIIKNWSPAVSASGDLYFTSNRKGPAEIFYINNDGKIQQLTDTPGSAESWSPSVSASGDLYFTSNRSGKAEIYYLENNGVAQRLTHTPGSAESWSPAVSASGDLYFTSNRSGKAEIYYIKNNGEVQQLTNTPGSSESWAPAVSSSGNLYFTSNRTGRTEIYYLKNNGEVLKLTNTPGFSSSWAPVTRGENIYFTSNRNGLTEVFLLKDTQAVAISEGWTSTLTAKYPYPQP